MKTFNMQMRDLYDTIARIKRAANCTNLKIQQVFDKEQCPVCDYMYCRDKHIEHRQKITSIRK